MTNRMKIEDVLSESKGKYKIGEEEDKGLNSKIYSVRDKSGKKLALKLYDSRNE